MNPRPFDEVPLETLDALLRGNGEGEDLDETRGWIFKEGKLGDRGGDEEELPKDERRKK